MPKVYCKREDAEKYKVKIGDTLTSIAGKYPDVTDWRALAIYNWGTDNAIEVNRALFENVGCSTVSDDHPEQTVLDPHEDASGEILIPKVWKQEGIELNKVEITEIELKPEQAALISYFEGVDLILPPGRDENAPIPQHVMFLIGVYYASEEELFIEQMVRHAIDRLREKQTIIEQSDNIAPA